MAGKASQGRLMSVVGNRPQFVKMMPVNQALHAARVDHILVHTGQHYDHEMNGVFFDELNLPRPDHQLEVTSSLHGAMTAEILQKLEGLMLDARPAGVIVYGDTNSTLAAALAAAKLNIPIGHVESGPRMYDMAQPEEVNRVIVDKLSELRFCSDRQSVKNLQKEGIVDGVYFTGDPMLDIFAHYQKQGQARPAALPEGEFILMTLHRPRNVDDKESLLRLRDILQALPLKVLFPVHPRTRKKIEEHGLTQAFSALSNLQLCDPLSYLDMMAALAGCSFVVTDSGGVQREAYFARKYCFSLFDVSPWPEIVEARWQTSCGFIDTLDTPAFLRQVQNIALPKERPALFGDGNAGRNIVEIIRSRWLA